MAIPASTSARLQRIAWSLVKSSRHWRSSMAGPWLSRSRLISRSFPSAAWAIVARAPRSPSISFSFRSSSLRWSSIRRTRMSQPSLLGLRIPRRTVLPHGMAGPPPKDYGKDGPTMGRGAGAYDGTEEIMRAKREPRPRDDPGRDNREAGGALNGLPARGTRLGTGPMSIGDGTAPIDAYSTASGVSLSGDGTTQGTDPVGPSNHHRSSLPPPSKQPLPLVPGSS